MLLFLSINANIKEKITAVVMKNPYSGYPEVFEWDVVVIDVLLYDARKILRAEKNSLETKNHL